METNILGLPSLTGYTPLKSAREGQILKYDFKGIGPKVIDKSGHGNMGTLKPNWPKNAPKRELVSLFPLDFAVRLDGKDDYIETPGDNLNPEGSFSIFARVTPGSQEQIEARASDIIHKGDVLYGQYRLQIRRGVFRFLVSNREREEPSVVSGGDPTEGTCSKIRGEWSEEENEIRLYVDGSLADSKTPTITPGATPGPFRIGIFKPKEKIPFKGLVHGVQMAVG